MKKKAGKNMASIYETILKNLDKDGTLPRSFSIDDKKSYLTDEIRVMPGAKEGMLIFHTSIAKPYKVVEKFVKILKKDWKLKKQKSIKKIKKLVHKYQLITFVDPLLDYIRKNHEGINPEAVFEYAKHLAFESDDAELVKLGIALFGLVIINDDERGEIINKLITLSVYEEFTLYVVTYLTNLPDGNDYLFKIAQKVNGWGKVHTVLRLEPENEEIRLWLLKDACGFMLDEYIALDCAQKGDLIGELRKENIENGILEGAGLVINALINEGPCEGISSYEHANEALERFLSHCKNRDISIKQLFRINNIKEWLKNCDDELIKNKDFLIEICSNILNNPVWPERIIDVINNHHDEEELNYAVKLSTILNMDVSDKIYACIKKDPVKYNTFVDIVLTKPQYANEVINIYEEIVCDNLSYLFCLNTILTHLKSHPNTGEKLIESAIKYSNFINRYSALETLQNWCAVKNQSLKEISPNLYNVVKRKYKSETHGKTKEMMKKLIKK